MKYIGIALILLTLMSLPLTTQGQGYWHSKERKLRYTPEGEDFVIVNGDRKFNRALYGGMLYILPFGIELTYWNVAWDGILLPIRMQKK